MWAHSRFSPLPVCTSGRSFGSTWWPNRSSREVCHGFPLAPCLCSSLDPSETSESYEEFRHPEGGRKEVFHRGTPGERPVAELQIYRHPSGLRADDLAGRIADDDHRELEAAGIIESKFGNVALFRRSDPLDAARSCLGFAKQFADPGLLISGWSCQGASLPAWRAAIACMLDRLTLLASGNEPRLADPFARAELRRSGCGIATAVSADWVTVVQNPRLRGAL
jgi:hypothetical protein